MKFSNICIITKNASKPAGFSETVFQTTAEGDDADEEYERLKSLKVDFVTTPIS